VEAYDVGVVGAGPAGAVVARSAATTGARVLLIEQGDCSGEPVQCTRLVSPRTPDLLVSRREACCARYVAAFSMLLMDG